MDVAAAMVEVRAAVRSALLIEGGQVARWRWSDRVSYDAFLDQVARHRVAPVLAPAAERLGLPAEISAAVTGLHNHDRLRAMTGLRAVAEVHGQLTGIRTLVLKGAPLAVQTIGDPIGRGAGDIDLLVDPVDLVSAVEALTAHGWTPRQEYAVAERSWAWRHQVAVSDELVLDGPSGSVDLHWRLDPVPDVLPRFDVLWRRRAMIDLGPVNVATPSVADNFMHALRHAAKDDWDSLRSLVDIHRLARLCAVEDLRLDRIAAESLAVTEELIGLPAGAAAPSRAPRAVRRALRSQARPLRDLGAPGSSALQYAGYCVRSSRSPRHLGTVAAAVALPPLVVSRIPDEHARTAIPKAICLRLNQAGARFAERRTTR